MDGFGKFFESTNTKLIIVDVQPAYKKHIWWLNRFPELVNQYANILVLYNGPDLGFEDKYGIAKFYLSLGIPREKIRSMKWFEKSYAWFIEAIEKFGHDEAVKIVRYMLVNKKRDIRDFTRKDFSKINVPGLTYSKEESMALYLTELYGIINKWNGADICGGGVNQCLAEVLVLAEAMKLKLNVIHQYTY